SEASVPVHPYSVSLMLYHSGGTESGSGAVFSICSSTNARPMQPLQPAFLPSRRPSLRRSDGAMLQPEKYEAHDRNQEIAVKNDAGVPSAPILPPHHPIDL